MYLFESNNIQTLEVLVAILNFGLLNGSVCYKSRDLQLSYHNWRFMKVLAFMVFEYLIKYWNKVI